MTNPRQVAPRARYSTDPQARAVGGSAGRVTMNAASQQPAAATATDHAVSGYAFSVVAHWLSPLMCPAKQRAPPTVRIAPGVTLRSPPPVSITTPIAAAMTAPHPA